jgi:o-succinylbenzoate synthase
LATLKITKFEIFRYDLPLLTSVQINDIELRNRSGLVIIISDQQGYSGAGEIAPLPGLHKENLDDVIMYAKVIKHFFEGLEIPAQLERLENGFESWIGKKAAFPSVRFGLEMAILNLLAERSNQSSGKMLSRGSQESIEINGLVFGEKDEIFGVARNLVREGYGVIKMKVGRKSVDQEIQIVEELREIINGRAQLRLDANRRWSFADAIRFAKSVGPEYIEYIEEPVEDLRQLDEFFNQTGMPIALDESLDEQRLDQLEGFGGLKAVVIKPSLIGGFERSMRLIRHAKARGIFPVISSAFESGLGLSALANFAASLNPGNAAMGLDTYRWFKRDLLQTRFETAKGKLNVESAYQRGKKINYSLLSSITNN